ncbi:UDP-N-acetylmuramoyl-L-alanyl-D-glutamate--2,6-diaminopimelate ligase [Candidatus Providencia siddallii]|uniref:UDP-N-acetylmuramoyl-L-alanyl-D-glutamate--2,6-diaminopimelate ligase n=1 Tax=Candidatus Providencia siddallii TaxID=1715285 RepID=A0ABP1CFA9_9GAMM
MTNNNLYHILLPFGIKAPQNIFLKNIKIDSRKVCAGDLFIAIKGQKLDGKNYITQAISQGASAIIADTQNELEKGKIYFKNNIPIIYLNNLNCKISLIANIFYNFPSSKMKLIGITGTNGKTTVSYLIAQLAKIIGEKSAVIGTNGYGIYGDKLIYSGYTTNSAVDIQLELMYLLKKNASLTAIEVSSHGLVQNRVSSLNFDSAIFTNLTHDHLDFHHNMKNYEAAKWLLFSNIKTKNQIINIDDKIGLKWSKLLPKSCLVTIKNCIPNNWDGYWLKATKIKYFNYEFLIKLNSSWGNGVIKSKLIGIFNITNLLLALSSLLMLNYSFKKLLIASNSLHSVIGRMEILKYYNKPIVIVDYAHTPDALEKALIAARLYCKKQLWCIFGCGGDRDSTKRSLMGSIAEKLADKIIITNDNPRNENQLKIINDILKGILNPKSVSIILDRSEAIANTISKATIDDVIMIAGKGHENFQIINQKTIEYSDRLIVKKLLNEVI